MGKLWGDAQSRRVAEWARDRIVSRSRRGIDADGKTFKRLSTGGPSTITDTGRMLDSLEAVVVKGDAVVRPGVAYAQYVEAAGRPFLGLTDGDLEELDGVVSGLLDETEAKLGKGRRG